MRDNPSIDPTCTADDGVTVLQVLVLELLEAAQIPTHFCDAIIHLIAAGELAREESQNALS